MKIRTIEDLQNILDSDFAWRFKELTILRGNINRADSISAKSNIRIGIVMLYAHWEGFIKNICESYLLFVSTRRLKYHELSVAFLAISMKDKLTKCELTSKATIHNQAIRFLIENNFERAVIPKKDIINTHSNLNFDNFKEIMSTVGLDYSPYELKSNQIDVNLVSMRNTVAHGQFVSIDTSDFNELYNDIISIMSAVKNDIENAVSQKLYRAN